MKILWDRLLVVPKSEEKKTTGGIIIPDTKEKDKIGEGKVLMIGDGYWDQNKQFNEPPVKKGDTILFGKYAGSEIKLEDKEILVLKFSDIIAILEGKEIDW